LGFIIAIASTSEISLSGEVVLMLIVE